jgi:predicted DNA-binding transcriptional regulator AlpA
MPLFLNVTEVAALLRKPKSWVYEQTRRRTIPCYGGGRALMFDSEEVVTWYKDTFARNSLSPSARRGRQVLAGSRRGAPHGLRGSHQRTYAGQSRGSAQSPGAVATSLPSAVHASPVDEGEH